MRSLNISQVTNQLTRFIKHSVNKAGFKYVVVAVSGGVDSATSCALVVGALGKENVHTLLLPYKNCHDEAVTHARLLLKHLKILSQNIHEIDISSMVDSFIQQLTINNLPAGRQGQQLAQIRIGNIMARVRMIVLFDLAKKLNALVVGTENKSEHLLGYFTRFGDEASDIEPLRYLYKTEVYQLAKHLKVPREIINKAPTAGLWSGQTDEGEFGFTYQEADKILYGLFDEKVDQEELIKRGFPKKTIEKVRQWVQRVDFKHHLPHIAPKPQVG